MRFAFRLVDEAVRRGDAALASSAWKRRVGNRSLGRQGIVFGQSAAFTGPAAQLGTDMKRGIEAAFHEINRRGGVHGRRLELVSRDDAYEPEAAIANTLYLINEATGFSRSSAPWARPRPVQPPRSLRKPIFPISRRLRVRRFSAKPGGTT